MSYRTTNKVTTKYRPLHFYFYFFGQKCVFEIKIFLVPYLRCTPGKCTSCADLESQSDMHIQYISVYICTTSDDVLCAFLALLCGY